jgi:hypothetical protein
MDARNPRSIPEQKASPSPVRITVRTSGLSAALMRWSYMSSIIGYVMALRRVGLSIVITAERRVTS